MALCAKGKYFLSEAYSSAFMFVLLDINNDVKMHDFVVTDVLNHCPKCCAKKLFTCFLSHLINNIATSHKIHHDQNPNHVSTAPHFKFEVSHKTRG